ncbi:MULTISPECIES: efflux transporter outer membrane subunit [unclassified Phenylobacterium]|uniref:efflux transporter outer membrane subunit n=1 Tax=unclassified Phenylobacterium TaxID=2640670 RepID=UPI00083B64E1|nr:MULTISPECIES: efflux transporter outer membrane subunit [unclassified Phenylobacterium]
MPFAKPAASIALAPLLLLSACALQPPYKRPPLDVANAWDNAVAATPAIPLDDRWWTQLGDPAVDHLVAAGLADSPTLAEAAARVDQARAARVVQHARRLPAVAATGSAQRSRDGAAPGQAAADQTSAGIGASLSWELDPWGRVREGRAAAESRVTASTADAEAVRLALIGDIADTTLALRACHLTLDLRDRDIASRRTELQVTRARLALGGIAPVAVATAASNLATAQTDRIAQEEACRRLVDALVALTGEDGAAIRAAAAQGASAGSLPSPPAFTPQVPAAVLIRHPAVLSAEREAAARWSEIAEARADRLPRIDLTAAFSQQWIRALGATDGFLTRSLGAGLTGPLFDGGAGAANVRGADARYREAVARLDGVVRVVVRDIEDGLAAQQSAADRTDTSQAALESARMTLDANSARWRAGAIAQVELEESRRQFNRAQESVIAATADRARAWVALVRRSGGAWTAPPSSQHEEGRP